MTLYHFSNCVAIIYVPYYITYKCSGLSEYGVFWKCIQAGGVYVFTQLFKMLIMATFFDSESTSSSTEFNLFTEFLRSSVDIVDLLGLALVLSRIPGKGHSKLVTAGLGWAGAEVILSKALLLWVGAKGAEFSWVYVQKCLDSNIAMVQHIIIATLLWLCTRHDLSKQYVPVVTILLAITVYRGVWLDGLLYMSSIGPWLTLVAKAFFTFVLGCITLHIYTGLVQTIGI